MSKAFTKEDVDPPERSGRLRSASGLPPGATNYITPGGVKRLQQELTRLRSTNGGNEEKITEIEATLKSITVVEPPEDAGQEVGFGARVTVRDATNQEKVYRILGVDELGRDPDGLSWISPLGKTLLAAKLGERVILDEKGPARIEKIEYPRD